MKFREYIYEMEYNDLNQLVPGQTNFDSNLYNDFFGFMGKNFNPITTKYPEYGDYILQKTLQKLKDDGLYSKDIQNILDPNEYEKLMNDWKLWLEFNKKEIGFNTRTYKKSQDWMYIQLYNKLKEKSKKL